MQYLVKSWSFAGGSHKQIHVVVDYTLTPEAFSQFNDYCPAINDAGLEKQHNLP